MTLSESEVNKTTIKPSSEGDIDLLEMGRILWKQRLHVFASIAICTVLALLMSFVLPKKYAAESTILPVSGGDSGGSLAAAMASQMGAAGSLLAGIDIGSSRTAELVEILGSRSMAERVIAKCQLETKLKGWKTKGDLIQTVMKMTKIVPPTAKSKIIKVHVQHSSPQLAMEMANAYIQELKGMLDEIGYNNASRNRKFIESQLAKIKSDLSASEEKLTSFQANSGLASLPDTVMASIKSMSELEAQQIEVEVQLQSAEEVYGAIQSNVSALQADPTAIVDLDIKRKALAAQKAAIQKAKNTFRDQLTHLPPKALTLARLQRDVKVQSAIYLALSERYESAMINENKESDAFLTLDKALVPDRPFFPKKRVIVLAGFVAGCLLGCLLAAVRHLVASSQLNYST
ncbi:putative tyrosine-protein kinase in cps region [compost metagenome]